MHLLTVNCGSSSLKCALLDTATGTTIRQESSLLHSDLDVPDVLAALMDSILADLPRLVVPRAVVHRVVHGGAEFSAPTLLDDAVIQRLQRLDHLAPLHNPAALAGIRSARNRFIALPQVAVFDTAFHASLPEHARRYALPATLSDKLGIRRFGFHGLAHASVMRSVQGWLGAQASRLHIISCHLGNGASLCAIQKGRSVETSMGFTPLEGLVMGSRAGDLDPGAMIEILRTGTLDLPALDDLLSRGAGMLGLTGTQDMAEIERRAAAGDDECRRALDIYSHRIRRYLGAYAAVMGGVDVIAFTGGVGENDAALRERCLRDLEFLGVRLDDERNWSARVDALQPLVDIGRRASFVRLVVIAVNEALEMALQAADVLAPTLDRSGPVLRVAVSARHAHLSQATIDSLFGPGYTLSVAAPLGQPGQFAAHETITLTGPRGRLDGVRLIGPPRPQDQIEISRSDEHQLGMHAPLRLSGDLQQSAGLRLVGPKGEVQLTSGVICAQRHVHMSTDDAGKFGIADGARLRVRVGMQGRDAILEDVRVRVSDAFATELHLDTDEANATGVASGDIAQIVG